jgi:hypothetical protein
MGWQMGELVDNEAEMNLSEEELTVLLIASRGESMMAIGHWQKPVESLVAKGFLQSRGGDNFNCSITVAGRAACGKREQEDMNAFKTAVNKIKQQVSADGGFRTLTMTDVMPISDAMDVPNIAVPARVPVFDVPKHVLEAASLVYHWMRKNRATQLHGLRLSDE